MVQSAEPVGETYELCAKCTLDFRITEVRADEKYSRRAKCSE